MKLSGHKIQREFTPLRVSGSLNVTGGSVVQFYDGVSYTPNREGTPSSPILLTHSVRAYNIDSSAEVPITYATTFYENDVVITSGTAGYELLGNSLKVKKNIPGATAVVIKAVSKFVDTRNNKIYEREDAVTLRTIIKAEAQYQLDLSEKGIVYFDGYRNPNSTTTVTATLKKGMDIVTDMTGITLKWLNSDGLDAVENELYADSVSADGKTLTIDKTYINHELIKCEAWKDGVMIATENVTFVRKFNSFRTDIRVPELPLLPGVNTLSCSIAIIDILGNIDVDAAFLVTWMVSENGVDRAVATGASVKIPVSSINMAAANLSIYPDIKRREAFAALTSEDPDELLTDDSDNVLTVETYGI
jgi:hypothetical protein